MVSHPLLEVRRARNLSERRGSCLWHLVVEVEREEGAFENPASVPACWLRALELRFVN